MRRAGRYFWPRNQMSHLWIRRTISGGEGGAVPCCRLQRLLQQPRLGGCRRDIALPACPVSPDLEPPTAREVVQSHCTHFSSVLTLSALRPGLLYRGSLLGALTNRQETKSFTVRTHCLPGANFEQKKKNNTPKTNLFHLFINPEPFALKADAHSCFARKCTGQGEEQRGVAVRNPGSGVAAGSRQARISRGTPWDVIGQHQDNTERWH